jgi:membrane-associated protease RseP (regulator of RpoE activity)
VSSQLPLGPPAQQHQDWYVERAFLPPARAATAPSAREWTVSVALFLLTLLSTTFAGLIYAGGDAGFIRTIFFALSHPSVLVYGLPFSVTFLSILLAHELGHYFACRYYGIRCTPPYFIPLPISIAGTLGAFIRIKSNFDHKRALFDVGVAGPLAGFFLVVPALIIGIANSHLIPRGSIQGGINFGEPLIFRWMGQLLLGYSPSHQDMVAHPIAMAAWFGLLATCLNLLPVWQLDGGHIAYAILGRGVQRRLSIIATAALILVSFAGWPPSYLVFGLLLLGFGLRFRFYHPPTLADDIGVGPARIFIGLVALVILIISFTPVPITLT